MYCQQLTELTIWKDSVMGAIYNKTTQSVAYNRPDKKGNYKIYISDTLGNNERSFTCPLWSNDRQQWAEEWTPDGKFLFCYVEKTAYVKEEKHKRKPVDAVPGYGAYTDLWVISSDGKRFKKILDLPNNYNSGLIHAAISQDGKLFAWTERIKAPKFLNMNLAAGTYVFRVADIVYDSMPHFENVRTYVPGNVSASGELDGISPDNTTLAFYSTFETKNLFATPIYTLNMKSGAIKKLTAKSFAQAPTYIPAGNKLVYMTGDECKIFPLEIRGADWWLMDTTGENKRRLTFMNIKNHPHSVNHYRLAGTISFISDNSFLGGVMTKPLGLIGYTVKVRFFEK